MSTVRSVLTFALVATAGLGVIAPPVAAGDFEVSGIVGVNEPLDQDDAGSDLSMGGRVRWPVTSGVKLEVSGVNYDMDSGPYRVRGIPQEVRSWSMFALTGGATFGGRFGWRGVQPFATVGAGIYFLRKEERPDTDRFGLFGALGLNGALREEISADLAATLDRVSLEGGGSRAIIGARLSINYHLGLD